MGRAYALVAVAIGGGCFGPAIPSGVACSSEGHCPGDQTCDPASWVCDGTSTDGGRRDGPPADVPAGAWIVSPLGLGGLFGTDEDPTMTSDRLLLVFARRVLVDYQLFQATRASVGAPWSTPVAISELNTGSQETSPELSPDGRTLYFTSNRASGNNGGRDVYVTTRADRTAAWGAPTLVSQLSTAGDDVGLGISPDGMFAVLDSDVSGERDLYTSGAATSGWSQPVLSTDLSHPNREEGSPTVAADRTVLFHVLVGLTNFNIWAGVPQMGGGYTIAAISDLAGYGDPFIVDESLVLCARNGQLFQATR